MGVFCITVSAKCKNCFYKYKNEGKPPCPHCGEKNVLYVENLSIKIKVHQGYRLKHKRPGIRRPLMEAFLEEEKSIKLNKMVTREMIIDRENNHYIEKVVDPDTGEVIHSCDELLTEHFGHGSAKIKTPGIIKPGV